MAVAFSVLSTAGAGGGTNGTIGELAALNAAGQQTGNLSPGASDTTCVLFVEYNAAATTSGWTVRVGASFAAGATASLISGSSFNETLTAQVSCLAFELKSPVSGAQGVFIAHSSLTVACYVYAITFTGSDTVNPSVAWGSSNSTSSATATTGASGSSIPSSDMAASIFGNAAGDFGTAVGNYGNMGGTGLTFVDHNSGVQNNVGATRISGNNNTITLTATPLANDGYVGLGVWVQVPAVAAKGGTLPMMGVGRRQSVGWVPFLDPRQAIIRPARRRQRLLLPHRRIIPVRRAA